jgi:type IVB pilus formation R64 PilN family outer membrane protein
MDVVTAKFGLSWKREDGRVVIYNLDTQTFHLFAFESKNDISADSTAGTTMASGVTGGGTTGTGGNTSMSGQTGSSQTARISIKTSIWDDLKNTVNTIKSPKGTCTTSPSTGTITCTDTGEGLRRVAAFVKSENANLTKQVLFHVKIFSVTFKNNNSLGMSWTAIYETLKNKYSIKLATNFSAPAGAAQGTFSVLDNSGSRWQGSDAVFSALSEYGSVSIIKEPSIPTLNLQAAPIQVANVESFVPGSLTSSTASVGTTTSLQVGTVTTGFAMTLLPYVLPGMTDQMLLHFSLTLSALDDIRKITVGDAYAEAPIINLPINSVQKVRLRSGQTLMLTGFDQNTQNTSRKGTTSPSNFLFGGGTSGNETRSALVVLITPVVDIGEPL